MKNKFIIVTPFYNVEEWVKYCVRSVAKQQYDNYSHFLIDDISTDNSADIIENEALLNEKIKLIKNTTKKYALKNIYDTLEEIKPDDEDIIVILDGDDWLANGNVLNKLNQIYNETDCWMTYGSYMEYPSKVKGKFAKQIPEDVIRNGTYRESPWMSSHLRTFRYKLWKNINKNDFISEHTGKFVKAAWDLAFVFPMLEMSGNRAHYVEDILYIYNRQNPLNEDKVDHTFQLREESEMRARDKYQLLEDLL